MHPIRNKEQLFSFYSFSFYNILELQKGLKDIINEIGSNYILRQSLFYPSHIKKAELLNAIKDIYKDGNLPATSLICQPVAGDMEIGIELWLTDYCYIKHISDNMSLCCFSKDRWAFVSGIESNAYLPFNKQINSILNKMHTILDKNGFKFSQLIRTWYYIGGILQPQGSIIRYDLLNSVRGKFYDMFWNKKGEYPASTGIGMNSNNIIMDGIALIPSAETRITRLENPLQISAFDYNLPADKRPRFCRAISVENRTWGIIMFISGTASIRGADVVFPEDIENQTYTTIENIKKLISADNLRHYNIRKNISLSDIKTMRIYIKDKSYYNLTKAICERFFPDIPKLYLIADICRPELLVEIEAILIKA